LKFQKIDHVGVIVNDLPAAKEFFLEFGLEVKGEWEMEGDLMGYAVGLKDVRVSCVGLGMPEGQTWIVLIKFISPTNEDDHQQNFANTPRIRHIAFAVEDIEAVVAKLKTKGIETFSELQQYEDIYKLCFVRGPEGIILELSDEMK